MESHRTVWYEFKFQEAIDGGCRAEVRIPADSPWFDGHFPDRPVLPGIAQLAMVQDLVKAVLPGGGQITDWRRVRFKRAVVPGSTLTVIVVAGPEARGGRQLTFRILDAEVLVCSGMAVAVEGPASEEKVPMDLDLQHIMRRIAAIMISEIKLEDVTPETFDPDIDLVDEVGIDSMDLATVALVLRDEYGVRIDEDDYPKLTTLRLIATYIHSRLQAAEIN
jgi:acyl carrier protein